jgi:penicillin G amidase
VSFHWGDTQRIQRWRRLMQAREVHTRDSFIEAQLDTVSVGPHAPAADRREPVVHRRGPAPAGTPERLRQRRSNFSPNGTAR